MAHAVFASRQSAPHRGGKPSVIRDSGLTLGFTLPISASSSDSRWPACCCGRLGAGLERVLERRIGAPRAGGAGAQLRRLADRGGRQCGLRRDRRLGAGALSTFPAGASSTRWSTCPSRCPPPSPASRSRRSMRPMAGSAPGSSRSASRSPSPRWASWWRSPSSACPSSSARWSRCCRISTPKSRRRRRPWAPAGCRPSGA